MLGQGFLDVFRHLSLQSAVVIDRFVIGLTIANNSVGWAGVGVNFSVLGEPREGGGRKNQKETHPVA